MQTLTYKANFSPEVPDHVSFGPSLQLRPGWGWGRVVEGRHGERHDQGRGKAVGCQERGPGNQPILW